MLIPLSRCREQAASIQLALPDRRGRPVACESGTESRKWWPEKLVLILRTGRAELHGDDWKSETGTELHECRDALGRADNSVRDARRLSGKRRIDWSE
jgi:hypothetical protein